MDLGRVTWVLSGDEHVAEYRAPANVVSAGGRKLVDLLLEGEIDALIGTGVDHPAVVPPITSWIIERRSVRCDFRSVRNMRRTP